MERRFETKKLVLFTLYERFDRESEPFRQQAFCKAGCSFCCTFMGNIDILTLEGLVILEHIRGLPKESQETLRKRISENMTLKEKGQKPPCPFLNENNTCLIYRVRPFSCRQLYSVRECSDSGGPMTHRQAVEASRSAVRELQRLDDTGYSGHISYVLQLLNDPSFRKLYLSGGFAPEKVMKFGKAHRLIINRLAK
jgi:Fe-S-cluster containining protein